jgi:hypothetical protein
MVDKIIITILEDGTIKTQTDTVSAPNHQSADKFLADMARLAGGATEVVRKGKGSHHHHVHAHEGHGSSH